MWSVPQEGEAEYVAPPSVPKGKAIYEALASYRCQYTKEMVSGDGLGLVDVLTPDDEGTIKFGTEELELLADHIYGELTKGDDGE